MRAPRLPRQPRARCPASLVEERPGLEITWEMELGGRDDVSRWEAELGGRDDVRMVQVDIIDPADRAAKSVQQDPTRGAAIFCALSRPRTLPACSDSLARPVAG